jgi:hypothetical protein
MKVLSEALTLAVLLSIPVLYLLLRLGTGIVGGIMDANYKYKLRRRRRLYIDTSSRPYRCEWREPPPTRLDAAINKLVSKLW